MGLFRKKEKKPREVRGYTPPRPLSSLGAWLLILVGAAMLVFALAMVGMRLLGKEAEAVPYTYLENGEVKHAEAAYISSTFYFTFADENGTLHAGKTSLLGNSETIGSTVRILYLPSAPEINLMASRAEQTLTQLGCLLLGLFAISAGSSRLKEIRTQKAASRGDDPAN